jgi:hypothetical protein
MIMDNERPVWISNFEICEITAVSGRYRLCCSDGGIADREAETGSSVPDTLSVSSIVPLRLCLCGGDAATTDEFTFSHYPDPVCRPHAPAGVGTARELTDFPQTARARVLAVVRPSLKA